MKKLYTTSLFIFRRDLRLVDNTGLNSALAQSTNVLPCFIFDPRQIEEDQNPYKSTNALQFMIESLASLHEALGQQHGTLYFFHGNAEDVVETLMSQEKIDAVFVNRDYTPFSIARDKKIAQACIRHDVVFEQTTDIVLNEPEAAVKKNGTPYAIFSAFYKNALTLGVRAPAAQHAGNWFTAPIKKSESPTIFKKILPNKNKNIAEIGGRQEGCLILKHCKQLSNYAHDHDYPALSTSRLSGHLKFGTVSVREVFAAIKEHLGPQHPLLRQLYWRDFFTHIAYHKPTIFGLPYNKKYTHIPWSNDKTTFKAWCEGKTGFPLVDAGMRQLNATGFMHNRVRMIVASFLVKDLHINWLWGEKYFAQQLVDYDPALNNGNWQWCASTGCDAQPYFRIFNPWLQQKKYDAECAYIKQWIPELNTYDPKVIHNWFKENSPTIKGYPRPIIDHKRESVITKQLYRKAN